MGNRSIAILGGMGPQASARLVTLMVEMCTKEFGIKIDSDFPEIILDSVPVSNFISNRNNSRKALGILKERVEKLQIFNPICFGISCNTAHILLPQLQKSTKIPFISIIEEVANEVYASNINSVGLLASPTTISSNLYQFELKKKNIKVIIPSKAEVKTLDLIIRSILAGRTSKKQIIKLGKIADSLIEAGAEGIILGCTELPLIFPKRSFSLPIFDSVEILARSLLNNALV